MPDQSSGEQQSVPQSLNPRKRPSETNVYVDDIGADIKIDRRDNPAINNVDDVALNENAQQVIKNRRKENREKAADRRASIIPDSSQAEILDVALQQAESVNVEALPPGRRELAKMIKDQLLQTMKRGVNGFVTRIGGVIEAGKGGVDAVKNGIEQASVQSRSAVESIKTKRESKTVQKQLQKLIFEANTLKMIMQQIELSATNTSTQARNEANQVVQQAEKQAEPDKIHFSVVMREMKRVKEQNTELYAELSKTKKNQKAIKSIRAGLPHDNAPVKDEDIYSEVVDTQSKEMSVAARVLERVLHPERAKKRRTLESNQKKLAILQDNAQFLMGRIDRVLIPAYTRAAGLNEFANKIDTRAANEIKSAELRQDQIEQEIAQLQKHLSDLDKVASQSSKNKSVVAGVRTQLPEPVQIISTDIIAPTESDPDVQELNSRFNVSVSSTEQSTDTQQLDQQNTVTHKVASDATQQINADISSTRMSEQTTASATLSPQEQINSTG